MSKITDSMVEAFWETYRQGLPSHLRPAFLPTAMADIIRKSLEAALYAAPVTAKVTEEGREHQNLADVILEAVKNTRQRPAGLRGPYVITDEELDEMIAALSHKGGGNGE